MLSRPLLHDFLSDSAENHPSKPAVLEPGQDWIDFRGLDELSDRLRDRLIQLGVRSGDRVGIYLSKSIDSVASIFGILKAGAAYVPVDPYAPQTRCAYIFADCSVKAVVVEARLAEGLASELGLSGVSIPELAADSAFQPGYTRSSSRGPGLPASFEQPRLHPLYLWLDR
jgi:acyl-CoA synthetase (AMP-forming)/AMP-acid ligase II